MDTKKKKITEEGQLCWHCGSSVVKKIPRKKSRGKRAYYYTYYFKCSNRNCPAQFVYMPEEAKRFWSEKSQPVGGIPSASQQVKKKTTTCRLCFPQIDDDKDRTTPPELPLNNTDRHL
jgi:hypothetical protein